MPLQQASVGPRIICKRQWSNILYKHVELEVRVQITHDRIQDFNFNPFPTLFLRQGFLEFQDSAHFRPFHPRTGSRDRNGARSGQAVPPWRLNVYFDLILSPCHNAAARRAPRRYIILHGSDVTNTVCVWHVVMSPGSDGRLRLCSRAHTL